MAPAALPPSNAPSSPFPLPPEDLIVRVTGQSDAELFDRSGARHVEDLGAALAAIGRGYEDVARVYDFGCGCGRILRHLAQAAPHARLYASDIDEPAVAWVTRHIPIVDARVNGWLPQLPFPRASFDLVIGYSVFTHLNERFQDAWLNELRRVTKAGGILLLTVHGEKSWRWHCEESVMANVKELAELEADRGRRGFVHWDGEGWEALFPDYYHTSFHLTWYIRERWSRWFDVEAILEAGGWPNHDIVVLRRPRVRSPFRASQLSLRPRPRRRARRLMTPVARQLS
ncbi:MAG: class I SAM-dependent methyltransferase [Actinomycetota bacterium]|nr:class I SAM-dependent methyltransferase [Actinomycetota bacterium]